MNPDERSPGGDAPVTPTPTAPTTPTTNDDRPRQDAAANVIRSQISTLYGDNPVATPSAENTTYHRNHNPHPAPQADQWKEYHSAWQNYYQKYYENYYAQQPQGSAQQQPAGHHYFSQQPEAEPTPPTAEELSNDEALFELRQKLLGRVQASAQKIRRSRHFIPIVAALLVVLVFVFLQYNRVLIANVRAYVSPGSIDPQNIVVDPDGDVSVTKDPRLIIPKINVDVPVIYDIGADYDSQMAAMEKGVAHFAIPGANSHPGETGNTVIAGHSSNDLFDTGNYKFIFAQLEKLKKGDSIYANYEGKRYTYVITKTEVVKPTEVNKLIYKTNKPVMTLITCTPLGTALNRLLVTAEQVSPDPSTASKPVDEGSGGSVGPEDIPGNSPTFLERIFGSWN